MGENFLYHAKVNNWKGKHITTNELEVSIHAKLAFRYSTHFAVIGVIPLEHLPSYNTCKKTEAKMH